MTKIRTGQAPAQLSRIQFRERFAQSFKDPLFAPEAAALARVEDVAWQTYKAVPQSRAGRLSEPDANLESPRPK